jgi:hypothetical protein
MKYGSSARIKMKPESKWMDTEAAEGEEGPPQRVFKKEAAEAVALHMKLQRAVSRTYPPPFSVVLLSPSSPPDITALGHTSKNPAI